MIVVLNGPSSAGKSTLAKAARARAGANCAAISIDQFYPLMHPEAQNGWHLFATLTDAMFMAVAGLASGGYDVIVDTVFERAECIAMMHRALGDHSHRLVAVTCPVDVLEARERERGNRRAGQAREQHERVFHDAKYELRLDTHAQTVEDCITRVVAVLRYRQSS